MITNELSKTKWFSALLTGIILLPMFALSPQPSVAQTGSRTFPETGMTVSGIFLQYWDARGGLAQQGYPISGEMEEISDTDGKIYTVQYFERAVFEWHPENRAPNNVLLSLLGTFLFEQKYPFGAPSQQPNVSLGSTRFQATGKRLGGKFLQYWQTHGGLAQQGYPISDEFVEVSDLDGNAYQVQYFERAVFEYHPANRPPYDVLLSQLGTFRYRDKYLSRPTDITGEIQDVTVDYDVFDDAGKKGMRIYVTFTVDNAKGVPCQATAYFYDQDTGVTVKNTDPLYSSVSGDLAVSDTFNPGFDSTIYEDFVLFMPYEQIHLTGEHNLYFVIQAYVLSPYQIIVISDQQPFTFTK